MNQPWVPHPDPPSNLPPHLITQSHPSAPALSTLSHASNLGWQSISHMMLFSQIIPPSPSPTESKSLFFTSVSLLLSLLPELSFYRNISCPSVLSLSWFILNGPCVSKRPLDLLREEFKNLQIPVEPCYYTSNTLSQSNFFLLRSHGLQPLVQKQTC